MQKLIPIVRNAGEGDKQLFSGGGLHIWKLLAEDTDGAFFLFEDTMVKDKTTPLHLHPEAHELTYVIDGEIEVQADGQRSRVRSGGISFVPKGVAHAFIVLSDEARLIGHPVSGSSRASLLSRAPATRPLTTLPTWSTSPAFKPRPQRTRVASPSSAHRPSRRQPRNRRPAERAGRRGPKSDAESEAPDRGTRVSHRDRPLGVPVDPGIPENADMSTWDIAPTCRSGTVHGELRRLIAGPSVPARHTSV